MRKVFLVVSLLVFAAGLVIGGGRAEAPGARPERVVLRFGHGTDEQNTWHLMAVKFKQEVEALTNGAVEVQIFPAMQLGDEAEMVRNTMIGTQDLTVPAMPNITPTVPQLGYFLLPYALESDLQARAILDEMLEQNNQWTIEEAGLRILGYFEGGFRVLSNSKQPIRTLNDLQGVRMRVPPNELIIQTYRAWGIEPIQVSWAETFSALQQGMADGQDNPYVTILSMSFYEVQRYITETDYLYNLGPLVINEEKFQSLAPEIQDALMEAGRRATQYGFELNDEGVEDVKAELEAKGMILLGPPQDREEWVRRAQAIWPNFYTMIGGGDPAVGREVIDILQRTKAALE